MLGPDYVVKVTLDADESLYDSGETTLSHAQRDAERYTRGGAYRRVDHFKRSGFTARVVRLRKRGG